jgi:hypothetical protein
MPTTEQLTDPTTTTYAPPATPPATAPDAGPTPAEPHRVARRLIERFALIAFGLYHLPLFLNNYPSLGGGGMAEEGLALSWGRVYTPPGVWVARHVFHIAGPMPNAYRGDNGDFGEEFGRLLLAVVIAAVAAACWTIADRRRPRARWAGDTLRVLLRYSIALGLASYAVAKILPVQFQSPATFTLDQRVGDLTPMTLLWTFMGYSRPYAFFGGVMELAVVLLLCFRRTATLGAVLCIAVMTNVALMNYAYGVPVKLYATLIVVSAAVLVLYDTPRLMALFVNNQTAPPAPLSSLPQDRIPTPARRTIKLALVGSVLVSSAVPMNGLVDTRSGTRALDGLWVVTSFARDVGAGDASGDSRWKRFTVRGNLIAFRLVSDSIVRCRASESPTPGTLPLACARDRRGELRWTRSGDTLRIDGAFDGTRVTASARLVKPSDYRLMQSKFRWIID